MCLAIPGRVIEIKESDPLLRLARVDYSGVVKEASLACVPEARVGDYVLVHAGIALQTLDEEEARRTLQMLAEMDPPGEEEA